VYKTTAHSAVHQGIFPLPHHIHVYAAGGVLFIPVRNLHHMCCLNL